MKTLVTGSGGLIGSALVSFLSQNGNEVHRLVRDRNAMGEDTHFWDPAAGQIDAGGLEGFDAIVHLAGRNIAAGRWTTKQKQAIRDSRVGGTKLLCDAIQGLDRPPKVLIAASAIGFYGDRGAETLNEESEAGQGFLPEVGQEWEAAAASAKDRGVRVVHLRLGVVLGREGGALGKMLLPFRFGLGGIVGSGEQYMSWIALDDVMGAIAHCIETGSLSGAVNCTTPAPVTNREFTKTLGRVLSRPTVLPLPAFAARLALGEMADALLLASTRVEPRRLLDSGYAFQYANLEDALRHELGR